ncbi:MAG: DUF2089 domain-containing protein [Candidatus Cloacimonetes bacterium]|nr:DUF2089 domain-containing protein [Candidatus Cloacimonadota bacterium]
MNKRLKNCPVCNARLEVLRYHCPSCDITIDGRFAISELSALSSKQQEFVKIFICCSGNIKEVEKKLEISYPTVKSRLNQIIEVLCPGSGETEGNKESLSILRDLEEGRISVSEAIKQMEKE